MACVPLAAMHILSSPRDQNFSKESFILAASPSSSMTLCLKHLICLLILLFYWNCIYHTKHSLFSYFTDSSSPFFFFKGSPCSSALPFQGVSVLFSLHNFTGELIHSWFSATSNLLLMALPNISPAQIPILRASYWWLQLPTGHLHLWFVKGASNSWSHPKWSHLPSSKPASLSQFVTSPLMTTHWDRPLTPFALSSFHHLLPHI